MKKYLIPVFFFCLLGLSCTSQKKDDETEKSISTIPEELIEVKVKKMEYKDFKHELIANGTIEATDKANLFFETSENVIEIFVQNGDRVSKGQKIARLDPFKFQQSLDQAKDNLERARLNLQEVLIGQGYSIADSLKVPKEVMQLAKVRSNFDQAKILYATALHNMESSVLYAPFSGVIANLFTKVYNKPDNSQAFCTVINNQSPEVSFLILENEISLVNKGDRVEISPYSSSDIIVEGKITEINPIVDANGMARIKAKMTSSTNRFYEGMNVLIRAERSLGKQLVIPKSALVLRTNRKVVFTFENDRAQWKYVQTGLENSREYVIAEGLSEGDWVIYEGNINLANETPVVISED